MSKHDQHTRASLKILKGFQNLSIHPSITVYGKLHMGVKLELQSVGMTAL